MSNPRHNLLHRFLTLSAVGVLAVASLRLLLTALAAPPTSPYAPGATLEPTCSPGSTNCTVTTPAISGANTDITSLLGLTGILSSTGGALFNAASTSALLIQNGSGANVFSVNTTIAGLQITGNATSTGFLVIGATLPPQNPLPAGSLYVGGNSTTTGNFTIVGYASTTNLVLADGASNLTGLNDLYVSGNTLYFNATNLSNASAAGAPGSWHALWSTALTPTNTSAGFFVNASSTVNSSFRVSGNSTTTGSFSAASVLYVNADSSRVGIGDSSPLSLFTVGSGDKFQIDNSGNATSSGFLVIGTTLPPQNPLPAGSLYVGGNSTTTGNLQILGYGSTTNLVLAQDGQNLGSLNDLYVNNGNLYFNATNLLGFGSPGQNGAWQSTFGGLALTPTNTSAGLFVTASSTIAANFRIDGNATTSGFLVIGTTLPPQNPLPAGSLYVGGSATTTGNLQILGYASTTNLVLAQDGQNLGSLNDLYVSGGNLYFNATNLLGFGAPGQPGSWQAIWSNTLAPTNTSAGFFVNASSTVAGSFRIDGNATATNSFSAGAVLYVHKDSGNVGINDSSPLSLLTVGADDKFRVDNLGNATSSGFLVIGTTLPPQNPLPAGSLYVGGNATTTGNFQILGYASTTNLVLADGASNLTALNDLYVSGGNLYYNATRLDNSAAAGSNGAWQAIWSNALAPTNTSAGFFVNASSTVAANFRIDGTATTTGNFTVLGNLAGGTAQPISTSTVALQNAWAFLTNGRETSTTSALFLQAPTTTNPNTGLGPTSAYYAIYAQDNPEIASTTYALYSTGGQITQTAGQVKHKGKITDDSVTALLNPGYGIAVQGRYAYVTAYTDDGVEVLDISSPTGTPVHVGSITDTAGTLLDGAYSIAVQGRYAYVTAKIDDGLEVLDISDPTRPFHVGSIASSTAGSSGPLVYLNGAVGIAVQGRYAYVTAKDSDAQYDGVEILDISDPANPRHVGSIQDNATTELNGAYGIAVQGRWAYVAGFDDNGFEVIDVANPASPKHIGAFNDTATTLLTSALGVAVQGKYAYVTGFGESGIEILDISDPTNPRHAGKFLDTASTWLSDPTAIAIRGNYAYVTSSQFNGTDDGVEILDIAVPTDPRHVAAMADDGVTALRGAYAIAVQGKFVYVPAFTDSGVEVLEITGLDVPAANIGSLAVSNVDVWQSANVAGGLNVASGLNVSGATYLAGAFSVGSSTTGLLHVDPVNNIVLIATSTSAETAAVWAGKEALVVGGNTYIQGSATTTGILEIVQYATSTSGFFTQSNGHIGGTFTIDNNATTTGSFSAASVLYVAKDWSAVGIGDATPLSLLTVGSGDKFRVDNLGNATSSGFLVIGTTLPPQNPLPAGSLYVGGNATTTGNFQILGYASTTNLVLADGASNFTALNDLYVSGGNLYYNATRLDNSAAAGSNGSWQAIWSNTLSPTNTSAGFFVNASSTVAANFRIDGTATTTGNFTVLGNLAGGTAQPISTSTVALQNAWGFLTNGRETSTTSALFLQAPTTTNPNTGLGPTSAYYAIYAQDNPEIASTTYALYSTGGQIAQTAGQVKHKGKIADDSATSLNGANRITVQGRYAYVTSGGSEHGVEILDISSATGTPVHVGKISDSASTLLNGAKGIEVRGRYAYVVSSEDGLEILDVSDPTRPFHAGSIASSTAGTVTNLVYLNNPEDIAVQGRYAYIASAGSSAVETIDISDPTNPRHVGAIADDATTELDAARGIEVRGRFAYIAASTDAGFEVLDIADPANPRHAGKLSNTASTKLSQAFDVAIQGKYAYVAGGSADGVEVIDISDPTNPRHAGAIGDTTATALDGARGIIVNGNYAFVGSDDGGTEQGVEVLDISVPTNPRHVAAIFDDANTLLNGTNFNINGLAAQGKYVYFAALSDNGVDVLEISGLDVPAANIGSLAVSNVDVWQSANIAGGLNVASGLNVSGATMLSGAFSVGSSTTGLLHVNPVNNLVLVATSTSAETAAVWANKEALVVGGNTYINGNTTSTGRFVVGAPTSFNASFAAGDITIQGTYYNNSTVNADYAETVNVADTVERGEVLSIDPDYPERFRRSTIPHDPLAAGIVSSNPAYLITASEGLGTTTAPLALAGRVPVKVSDENGPIRIGDALTTANTPGHAMRACGTLSCSPNGVIGLALEMFGMQNANIKMKASLSSRDGGMVATGNQNDNAKCQNGVDCLGEGPGATTTDAVQLTTDNSQLPTSNYQLGVIKALVRTPGSAAPPDLAAQDLLAYLPVTTTITTATGTSPLSLPSPTRGEGNGGEGSVAPAAAEELTAYDLLLTADPGSLLQGNVLGNLTSPTLVVGDVEFTGSVRIVGALELNADTIGEAQIVAGHTRVRVMFETPYPYPPIVTLTPLSRHRARYWVTDASSTGFTIALEQAEDTDLYFDWQATPTIASTRIFIADASTTTVRLLNSEESSIKNKVLRESAIGSATTTDATGAPNPSPHPLPAGEGAVGEGSAAPILPTDTSQLPPANSGEGERSGSEGDNAPLPAVGEDQGEGETNGVEAANAPE